MNLETKIAIYKFIPQVFTLTPMFSVPLPFLNQKRTLKERRGQCKNLRGNICKNPIFA